MAGQARAIVTMEEFVERRAEGPAGRVVWRRYRRARWEPPAEVQPSTTRQMLQTAGPLLRAVAIALAPAMGGLAVRALAPRLRAALPGGGHVRLLPSARPAAPLSLPAPGASWEDGRGTARGLLDADASLPAPGAASEDGGAAATGAPGGGAWPTPGASWEDGER